VSDEELPPIHVLGRGRLGVEEMVEQCLQGQDRVLWAVVRFTYGEGAFGRSKRVFLHLNFAKSIVTRGRQNAHTTSVQQVVGATNASVAFEDLSEVTLEGIIERVQDSFITDGDLGNGARASVVKRDIEAALEKARKKNVAGKQLCADGLSRMSVRGALRALAKHTGALNWVWFNQVDGKTLLWGGGQGSISDMQAKALEEGQGEMLHGLLRVSFGKGKLRRSKWAYIAWIGQNLGAVQRGRQLGQIGPMQDLMRKEATLTTTFEFTDPEDFTTEAILERIRKVALLDGDASEAEGFSYESYLEALEEDQQMGIDPVDDGGDTEEEDPDGPPDLRATLRELSDENSEYKWAVFALSESEMRKSNGRSTITGLPRSVASKEPPDQPAP
jgi:hypothetical protein